MRYKCLYTSHIQNCAKRNNKKNIGHFYFKLHQLMASEDISIKFPISQDNCKTNLALVAATQIDGNLVEGQSKGQSAFDHLLDLKRECDLTLSSSDNLTPAPLSTAVDAKMFGEVFEASKNGELHEAALEEPSGSFSDGNDRNCMICKYVLIN